MNKVPLETEEDLQLIKDHILLPILLDVLEKDIATMERVQLKMITIYTKNLRCVQNQITADLKLICKKSHERGIKIYEQQRTSLYIEARYLCRGYNHKFSMLWGFVKAELYKKLSVYMNIDGRSDL